MDAGAEDATIVELHVDDERAFVPAARLGTVSWGWLTALCMLVAGALWLAIGSGPFDSARHGVEMGDIERSIGSDLTGQLLGDLRVESVRCVRRSQTDARCVAELFDKSGDGPITQGVTVSIDHDTGDYFWQAGAAH
jgi:hypothetical protein